MRGVLVYTPERYFMSLDPATFAPTLAWAPLKAEDWNRECARHLLHRIEFSATPDRVEAAFKLGLQGTLEQAFGSIRPFTPPASMADYVQKRDALVQERGALGPRRGGPPPAAGGLPPQRQINMDINQLERQAFLEYVQAWLSFARQPENSAQENLVMCLGNVLVVAQSKVKDPSRISSYNDLLRTSWQKSYLDMCKAVMYSPAMIQYLDLNTSLVGVPNENFARELMELFTLGEGHYTENDVKEAARALTGIVVQNEQGVFARRRWDPGIKTIYGKSGTWGAEDVVDLIFTQPAASLNFPKRFLTYYLSQEALPMPYLQELGDQWKRHSWRVDQLARLVFSSNLFYRPEFRGALIKSPIQYYLGLCQDLNLDVSPFEGQVYQTLRSMGQEPFNPPNVRGWLSGKNWINSSTLAARRQLVQQMFNPPNERGLTADLLAKLGQARAAGHGVLAVSNERLNSLTSKPDDELADTLLNYYLAGKTHEAYRSDIVDYLQNDQGQRLELVRDVAMALFQSPEYHVC